MFTLASCWRLSSGLARTRSCRSRATLPAAAATSVRMGRLMQGRTLSRRLGFFGHKRHRGGGRGPAPPVVAPAYSLLSFMPDATAATDRIAPAIFPPAAKKRVVYVFFSMSLSVTCKRMQPVTLCGSGGPLSRDHVCRGLAFHPAPDGTSPRGLFPARTRDSLNGQRL